MNLFCFEATCCSSHRPAYRIGGVALLAIASGFFSLNFVVAYLYLFEPIGMSWNSMLIVGGIASYGAYMIAAVVTRSPLITYMSVGALISVALGFVGLSGVNDVQTVTVYIVLALALLLAAAWAQFQPQLNFVTNHYGFAAHLLLPLVLLSNLVIWIISSRASEGWLLLNFLLILGGYLFTDLVGNRPVWAQWRRKHPLLSLGISATRWVSPGITTLITLFICIESGLAARSSLIMLHCSVNAASSVVVSRQPLVQ